MIPWRSEGINEPDYPSLAEGETVTLQLAENELSIVSLQGILWGESDKYRCPI